MKPFIIFLNGPENETKQKLCASLQVKFEEEVCIYFNRKMQLKMFNNKQDDEESYEWVIHKMLKNFILQGIFVIFDGFLQTRRTKQYSQSLDGLPLYWIGVFFSSEKSEMSQEFYDFHILINEEEYEASQDKAEFLNIKANEIFEYVSKNKPVCFEKTNEVEKIARKREVYNKDRSFVGLEVADKNDNASCHCVSSRFDRNDRSNRNNRSKNNFKNDRRRKGSSYSDKKFGSKDGFARSKDRSFKDFKKSDRSEFQKNDNDFKRGFEKKNRFFRGLCDKDSSQKKFGDRKPFGARNFRGEKKEGKRDFNNKSFKKNNKPFKFNSNNKK